MQHKRGPVDLPAWQEALMFVAFVAAAGALAEVVHIVMQIMKGLGL